MNFWRKSATGSSQRWESMNRLTTWLSIDASCARIRPREMVSAYRLELQPTGEPAPGTNGLIRIDHAKADRVAGTGLGEERQVRADHGSDHRVTAGRLVVDMQDNQPAGRGDLDGARGHRHREDLLRLHAPSGGLQAQAHTIDLRSDATRRRAQPLERVTNEGVKLRTSNSAHLPGATE